jgi:hypothetical protein
MMKAASAMQKMKRTQNKVGEVHIVVGNMECGHGGSKLVVVAFSTLQ